MALRLLIRRPAPTSKTKLNATCATTRPERTNDLPRPPTTAPDSALSMDTRSILLVWAAGASPTMSVETRQTPAAQTSKIDLVSILRAESGAVVGGRGRSFVRSGLVV